MEMTRKKLGMTCVLGDAGELAGIFTDGDLRRALDNEIDIHTSIMADIMTRACPTIGPDMLAAEALHIMDERMITSLVVVDEGQIPVGILHVHDILKAGVA